MERENGPVRRSNSKVGWFVGPMMSFNDQHRECSCVTLSEAKGLRLCEMRSCAVKVKQEKWLHRPKEISFHTASLSAASAQILHCAQDDNPAGLSVGQLVLSYSQARHPSLHLSRRAPDNLNTLLSILLHH